MDMKMISGRIHMFNHYNHHIFKMASNFFFLLKMETSRTLNLDGATEILE